MINIEMTVQAINIKMKPINPSSTKAQQIETEKKHLNAAESVACKQRHALIVILLQKNICIKRIKLHKKKMEGKKEKK